MDKKVETFQAHPAAEAYRMMQKDELDELAASIKAHGLRDPITIGVIGDERWIVDGRNREKACEIVGVPPHYEEIEFADEGELRAFVADRSERRNITAGQKAIAWALLFPEAKHGGDRKSRSSFPRKLDPASTKLSEAILSKARTVFAYSPELANKVRDGLPLNDAYEMVKAEKQRGQSDEARRAELATEAPDLAALVKDEQMKLNEAHAAMLERKRQRQTAIEQAKFAADSGLSQFTRAVLTITLGASLTDEPLISGSRFAEITDAYETLKNLVISNGDEQ